MKKLSETLTELGIAFSFPIEIKDANGYQTYYENSEAEWHKYKYDAEGNWTYFEDSKGVKQGTQAYRDSGIELRKDKERLDWLIDNNCEIYDPSTDLLFCDCDRESIDEMMEESTR